MDMPDTDQTQPWVLPFTPYYGADIDAEPDDDTDPDDDADADDADDDTDEWTPPTQAEWERLQGTLRRASAEAHLRRVLLAQHGINHRNGKPLVVPEDDDTAKPDTTKPDADKPAGDTDVLKRIQTAEARAAAKAAAETETRLRPALVRAATEAALARAGWSGSNMSLATRLIDPEQVDVETSDDGEPTIVGIDEQIEAIRQEFPGWFKRRKPQPAADDSTQTRQPRVRRGVRDVDGDDKPPAKPPKTWLEKVSASIG